MRTSPLLLLLAGLAACGTEQPKIAQVADALPGLPLPPEAGVVSRSGNEEALQITFVSTLGPDQMVAFYRTVLNRGEWHLVSDTRTADGTYALYAERKGPPIWVRVGKTAGAEGSTVEIAGAVVKPAVKDSARS